MTWKWKLKILFFHNSIFIFLYNYCIVPLIYWILNTKFPYYQLQVSSNLSLTLLTSYFACHYNNRGLKYLCDFINIKHQPIIIIFFCSCFSCRGLSNSSQLTVNRKKRGQRKMEDGFCYYLFFRFCYNFFLRNLGFEVPSMGSEYPPNTK